MLDQIEYFVEKKFDRESVEKEPDFLYPSTEAAFEAGRQRGFSEALEQIREFL